MASLPDTSTFFHVTPRSRSVFQFLYFIRNYIIIFFGVFLMVNEFFLDPCCTLFTKFQVSLFSLLHSLGYKKSKQTHKETNRPHQYHKLINSVGGGQRYSATKIRHTQWYTQIFTATVRILSNNAIIFPRQQYDGHQYTTVLP